MAQVQAEAARIVPRIVLDKTQHSGYDDLRCKRIGGTGSRNIGEMLDLVGREAARIEREPYFKSKALPKR